jgi:hypothetical protein
MRVSLPAIGILEPADLMSVDMYVIDVRMYGCMIVWVYGCLDASAGVWMCAGMDIRVHMFMYRCMDAYNDIGMNRCIAEWMYECMYVR